MKGKLIAIEGIDGCGKETQSKLLIKKLKEIGKKTVLFAFPRNDTKIGLEIKRRLKTSSKPDVADLFTKEFLNMKPEIKNYLKRGYFVICDRYIPSNWAYQGVEVKGMPKADLIIFLDLPPQLAKILNKNKKKDAHEKNLPFLKKVYERYKKMARGKNWHTVKCYKNEVGAKWEILPKEIIAKKIWEAILPFVLGIFSIQRQPQ